MNLAGRLRDQLEHLERLTGLLDEERGMLGEGTVDGNALGQLAREKQRLLLALSDIERERHVESRRSGKDTRASAREHGCLALWREVRERAREAARLNHFNGKLIDARLIGNQRILNDLHALSRRDLYGPDGQARSARARLSSHA